jgi:hypothetical protein
LEHRKYWGVDDPSARKTRPWFWETFTEQSFLAKAQLEHSKLIEHYKKWNGLCVVGETIAVIALTPTSRALSKNWTGQICDHTDLEVELFRRYAAFLLPSAYECRIYSYGTITVLPGSMQAQMGERVGSSRIRHDRAGFSHEQDHRIALEEGAQRIRVWDATFEVLRGDA